MLTKAALRLLDCADFSVARCARAGLTLMDLSPARWHRALEPFEFAQEKRGVVQVVEANNERFGESKIGLGYRVWLWAHHGR